MADYLEDLLSGDAMPASAASSSALAPPTFPGAVEEEMGGAPRLLSCKLPRPVMAAMAEDEDGG